MEDYKTILEAFLQEDKKQAFTPSQTRLFLLLLSFAKERANERANERGYFPISIEELCKRYGTKNKKQIRKTRNELCERKTITYKQTTATNTTLYKIKIVNPNRYKNAPNKTNFDSENEVGGYKNAPVNPYENVPIKKDDKSTEFEALTPLGGSVFFTTQESVTQARAFFYSCCNKLQNKDPQRVDAFFRFWVTENEDGKLKYLDKGGNFDIVTEYEKY